MKIEPSPFCCEKKCHVLVFLLPFIFMCWYRFWIYSGRIATYISRIIPIKYQTPDISRQWASTSDFAGATQPPDRSKAYQQTKITMPALSAKWYNFGWCILGMLYYS